MNLGKEAVYKAYRQMRLDHPNIPPDELGKIFLNWIAFEERFQKEREQCQTSTNLLTQPA